MPHYKDGTEAKLGDVVKGTGYNIKHEIIGVLVGLKKGEATCNVSVACVTKAAEWAGLGQKVRLVDGVPVPIENYPLVAEITIEYGQADAFEKIA